MGKLLLILGIVVLVASVLAASRMMHSGTVDEEIGEPV
jgi:hypothetical protein